MPEAPLRRRDPLRLARRILVAALAVAAGGAVAASSAAAVPSDEELRKLEAQITEEINAIRTNPAGLVTELEKLQAGRNKRKFLAFLPDGSSVAVGHADPVDYLAAAIRAARTQKKLPALKREPSLDKVLQSIASRAPGSHAAADAPAKLLPVGTYTLWIEAINWTDAKARSHVYDHWISTDETPPGHRGIVNDPRMTHIAVGCGPPARKPWSPEVTCVINALQNWEPHTPAEAEAAEPPGLGGVSEPIEGRVGVALPETIPVTVDSTGPAGPEPEPEAATEPRETAGLIELPGYEGPADPATDAEGGEQPATTEADAGEEPATADGCANADAGYEEISGPEAADAMGCLINTAREEAGKSPLEMYGPLGGLAVSVAEPNQRIRGRSTCPDGAKRTVLELSFRQGASPRDAFGRGGASSRFVTDAGLTHFAVALSRAGKALGKAEQFGLVGLRCP